LVRSGLVDRSMSIAMMLRWRGTLRMTSSSPARFGPLLRSSS